MFTERKPSHRESLLDRWGLGAAESHRGSGKMGGNGALLYPSPFQPPDFQRKAGVGFDRVQGALEHSSKSSKSTIGSDVLFLKIQRAGPVKD